MSDAAAAKSRGFSVLVVEDDALLVRVYERGLRAAGATRVVIAKTLADGIARLGERFDVYWIDLGLPDGRGTPIVAGALRASSTSIVLVVSGTASPTEAYRLGWEHLAFFDKLTTPFAEVVATLHSRLALARSLDAAGAEAQQRERNRIATELEQYEADVQVSRERTVVAQMAERAGLTERQIEILSMRVDGLDRHAIALALGISVKTYDRHVTEILAKTGAEDMASLALRMLELALTGRAWR